MITPCCATLGTGATIGEKPLTVCCQTASPLHSTSIHTCTTHNCQFLPKIFVWRRDWRDSIPASTYTRVVVSDGRSLVTLRASRSATDLELTLVYTVYLLILYHSEAV